MNKVSIEGVNLTSSEIIAILKQKKIISLSPVKGAYFYSPQGLRLIKIINQALKDSFIDYQEIRSPSLLDKVDFSKEPIHNNKFSSQTYNLSESHLLKPTGEMVLYPFFTKYVKNESECPIKIVCENSVFRKENKNKPFIRSAEISGFLEFHSVFTTFEEAETEIYRVCKLYREILTDLQIPFIEIKRPDTDTFPGAVYSIAFDTIIDDKSLQLVTVHHLGSNFSRELNFTVGPNKRLVNQICFGTSERLLLAYYYHNTYKYYNKALIRGLIYINKKLYPYKPGLNEEFDSTQSSHRFLKTLGFDFISKKGLYQSINIPAMINSGCNLVFRIEQVNKNTREGRIIHISDTETTLGSFNLTDNCLHWSNSILTKALENENKREFTPNAGINQILNESYTLVTIQEILDSLLESSKPNTLEESSKIKLNIAHYLYYKEQNSNKNTRSKSNSPLYYALPDQLDKLKSFCDRHNYSYFGTAHTGPYMNLHIVGRPH